MTNGSSDTPVLDTLAAMTAESVARCGLDENSLLTARIAALVAVDAPAASYLMHIGPAADAGVTVEQVQDILIAVAPIVGTPRTVSAAAKITEALGIAIVALEAELEAEEGGRAVVAPAGAETDAPGVKASARTGGREAPGPRAARCSGLFATRPKTRWRRSPARARCLGAGHDRAGAGLAVRGDCAMEPAAAALPAGSCARVVAGSDRSADRGGRDRSRRERSRLRWRAPRGCPDRDPERGAATGLWLRCVCRSPWRSASCWCSSSTRSCCWSSPKSLATRSPSIRSGTRCWRSLVMAAASVVLEVIFGADDDDTYTLRVIQRIARRQGKPTSTDAPGIVYLEIDGLALPVLQRAMRDGHAPNLARWLEEGAHRLVEWETDLSSQTGASQAGILLGSNEDIPAFRWVEKETRRLMTCSAPADCAEIERSPRRRPRASHRRGREPWQPAFRGGGRGHPDRQPDGGREAG